MSSRIGWANTLYMHLYFARSRQSKTSKREKNKQNKQTRKKQAKNKYIAKEINTIPPWWHHACTWQEAWLDEKRNIPVVNYIQKNVCSIISVNCLLDLTLLPYFQNIFVCFFAACLAKREQNEIFTRREFFKEFCCTNVN